MTVKWKPARSANVLTMLAHPSCGTCNGTGIYDPPEMTVADSLIVRPSAVLCACIPKFRYDGDTVAYIIRSEPGGLVVESVNYPNSGLYAPVVDPPNAPKMKRRYLWRLDVQYPPHRPCSCDALGGPHDPFCDSHKGWPRAKVFQSVGGANRRAALLRMWGCTVDIERSHPIEWPIEPPDQEPRP
jgi:hypothetical protein